MPGGWAALGLERDEYLALGTARVHDAGGVGMPPQRLDRVMVGPYYLGMATTMVKTTYALDEPTVRSLEAMARRWQVSKSEALRRAIRSAAATELAEEANGAIAALNEAQQRVERSGRNVVEWARAIRQERRASASRR